MMTPDDGWVAHRRDQVRRVARSTTPRERLEWLEEALQFAARARDARHYPGSPLTGFGRAVGDGALENRSGT